MLFAALDGLVPAVARTPDFRAGSPAGGLCPGQRSVGFFLRFGFMT
jgi:hypothetical protein